VVDESDELDMISGADLGSQAMAKPLSREEAIAAYAHSREAGASAAASGEASADGERQLVVEQLVVDDSGEQAIPRFAFIGQFQEPSDHTDPQPAKPPVEASLEWIHGYRGWDCRSNVHSALGGDAFVYPAAGVVVVGKIDASGKLSQRFFTQHDDDVLSVAVHPNGRYVASGQIGRMARVLVWDVETLEVKQVLEGYAARAARHVAFSGDGSVIAVAGEDDGHSVYLFSWEASAKPVAVAKAGTGEVNGISLDHAGKRLITAAKNALCFYDRPSVGGKGVAEMKPTKVLMGGKGKIQTYWATVFLPDGRAIIGTHSGRIYEVDAGARSVSRSHVAHKGPVASVDITRKAGGCWLATSGKDGTVLVFDVRDGASIGSPVAKISDPSDSGLWASVRGAAVNPAGTSVVFGTRGGSIKSAAVSGGAVNTHVRSHHKDELWGLTLANDGDTVITTGDDETVRLWSISKRKMIRSTSIGMMARAVAMSPDGSTIAVGCGGRVGKIRTGYTGKDHGTIVVLSFPDLHEVARVKPSAQWISDVAFSPDGSRLAVAAHDSTLYLLNATAGFKVAAKGTAAHSFISRVDFSEDGATCRVNTGDHELLYFDAKSGAHIPEGASSFKDTVWATVRTPLNWHVQGVWPSYADGTDINAVAVDAAQTMVASGDDFGRVNLFRFPCIEHDIWERVELHGHSSHVTNVVFGPADAEGNQHLISAGGNDKCIFQWKLSPVEDEMAGRTDIAALA
jgi:WD40 repeat protein